MTTKIIFGPPGTGKTTYLINAVEAELASGIPPERIAFVSFTKAAVNEAVNRAITKFQYTRKQFRWFRTLHSMAFNSLGLDRDALLTDYREFAAASGLRLSYKRGEEQTLSSTEGDQFLAVRSLCAATNLPFDEVQKRFGSKIGQFRYHRLALMLDDYKKQAKVLEYHDLLQRFIDECDPLPVDVAFVDEAQDLTPKQWEVVNRAFRNVARLYIAGDDDQAIYQWAGADPARMRSQDGQIIVLDHSYRLNHAHVNLAKGIAERIKLRQPKHWHGIGPMRQQSIKPWFNWRDVDFGVPGSWLILARANQFLPDLASVLENFGLAYSWYGVPRIKQAHARMFTNMKDLLAGKQVKSSHVTHLLEESGNIRSIAMTRTEHTNIDAPGLRNVNWLSKWPRTRVQYFERVWRRYGAVFDVPCDIELTTIHQAKGTEADNVVLSTDMTPATWRAMDDAEHRVWYVSVTRSKNRLFILRPQNEHFYRIANF